MDGLDKRKIEEVIEAASMGSKFYEHRKKQQKRIDARIAELLDRWKAIAAEQLTVATEKVDVLVRRLQKSRDMSRTIVHIDMDAFYAAVEMRDNPSLRDKPMAVGGEGMLSTSNYAARRFGVRAAMPGFIARKLCPELIIVPLNFAKYREVSLIVGSVFAQYDPNYASMSLDEAYLDITDFMKNDHNLRIPTEGIHAEQVVEEIRAAICAETQLTASAGIAPNTFLAKVCSDINKPNGQFYLTPDVDAVMGFVRALPVRKAFGIGKVTEQLLSSLGIVTCEDLYNQRGLLSLLFTETSAMSFLRISLGLGSTHIGSDAPAKSVSTEHTFRDNNNADFLRDKCKKLCEELSGDLKKRGITAETVTLKLKTHEFDVKTRARRLPEFSSDGEVFWRHMRPLLETEMGDGSVSFRLMGVRASNLKENDGTSSVHVHQKTLKEVMSSMRSVEKTCPVCSVSLKGKNSIEVNAHVDSCLLEVPERKERDVECPVCYNRFDQSKIHVHVEVCLDGGTSGDTMRSRQVKRRSDPAPVDRAAKRSKKSGQLGLDAFFKKTPK